MSTEDWQVRAERIDRQIAFIIEQQARAEAQAEVRAAEADERWQRADERWTRTEEGIRGLLSIAEIHEHEIGELRELGRATDERLNALIDVVEKQISERRNGGS